MSAKSTKLGLVSLFAVAAMALGGCAESVGGTRANVLPRTATAFPDVVLPSPTPESDEYNKTSKLEKSAPLPSRLSDSALARSGVGYRTDGCGH